MLNCALSHVTVTCKSCDSHAEGTHSQEEQSLEDLSVVHVLEGLEGVEGSWYQPLLEDG